MRKALKRSYERTYGKQPASDIGVYIFSEPQIERYKIHGITKAVLHFYPTSWKLNFGRSKKYYYEIIIDNDALNQVIENILPKGMWFGKTTDNLSNDCDLELLISGKQQLPKKALEFNLLKKVEGVLITPHYALNKVDFDLQALYGEIQK